jgi:hypothetical protein
MPGVKVMADFAGGRLDGDTWFGGTTPPPVTPEAIDSFPDMQPWLVAEIFAETGQRFTTSVPQADKPRPKFPHVLAVTVNKIGCLLEVDYSVHRSAEYEVTERLEADSELLLRAEFRGCGDGGFPPAN